MSALHMKVWIVTFLLQVQFLHICEAQNSHGYNWWSTWYFWIVIFGTLACCFGACGSYFRRRMIEERMMETPVVTSILVSPGNVQRNPTLTQQAPSVFMGAPYPATRVMQPPQYSEVTANRGAPNDSQSLPPSYSDIYGTATDNAAQGTPGHPPR